MRSPIFVALLSVATVAWSTVAWSTVAWSQDHPFILRGQEHLQRGRYAEALESFAEAALDTELTLAEQQQLAVGRCRCHAETGDWQQALELATAATTQQPDVAQTWALLAELHYQLGHYDDAAKAVKQALDRNSQLPQAVLVYADLLTAAGRTEEAVEQYRWFVRFYNRTQPQDAETLVTVGTGASQYANWKSVSEVFNVIVNTVCVDALKADPDCWQALVLSGDLLSQKYNRAQAVPEYHAALAINPQCAAAQVGLGQIQLTEMHLQTADEHANAALKANPHLPSALRLKADIALLSEAQAAARPYIQQALAINPADQLTLARLAVCDLLEDGVPAAAELELVLGNLGRIEAWGPLATSRFGKTLSTLLEHNPRPGPFLHDVGQFLDSHRKFAAAELFYRAAIKAMPELSAPKTALGLLCMRTGRVDEARTILDAAFAADQFHVRVSNMRKLLDVLQTYETIETDHFIIHCDPSEHVLGQEMSAFLESIYDELTTQFDYEPPTRTHFEIYSDAKDQNAHAWFSTRMSGLPWIQTVGASTGMLVALASPEKTQAKYNWARVLKHEFVHILTLQKTGFNIPHWYTEALAVTSEGDELPDSWYDLLLTRVPAGETFTMATLNQGFQRPRNADDWTLAYCQSKLYARYFTQRFGPAALGKLTAAYQSQPLTELAVQSAFGVSAADIEAGYATYLKALVTEFAKGRLPGAPLLAEAIAQAQADPENAAANGELAYALIAQRKIKEGFEAAEKAHQLDPTEPLSATFLARRALIEKKLDEALALLQAAYNEQQPHPLLLDAYAEAALRNKQPELAEQLLQRAVDMYPLELDFVRDLLLAKTGAGRDELSLQPLLEIVAVRDVDDVATRKRLARLALERQDWATALRWGNEVLYIDTLDTTTQRLVATAAYQAKDDRRCIRAWQTLDSLETLTDADRLQLAKSLKRTGQKQAAREELLKVPASSESYKAAQTELKLLDAGR